MKGSVKNKFSSIKENVKHALDKTSESDKSKVKKDINDRNFSGASDTKKKNLSKRGKV